MAGKIDALSFEIPAGEVVCIAQLPKLIKACFQKANQQLIIQIAKPLKQPRLVLFTSAAPNDSGKEILMQNQVAEIKLTKVPIKAAALLLKLFDSQKLADQIEIDIKKFKIAGAKILNQAHRFVAGSYDICFSPTCIADFRRFVKEEYGSLENLNREWRTGYNSWAEVEPITLYEVQRIGRFL